MLRLVVFAVCTILFAPVVLSETLTVQITDAKGNSVPNAVITYTPLNADGGVQELASQHVISQENLRFQPFVTLAPVDAQIAFKNEDSVLHHVFSFSKGNRFDLKLFGRDAPQEVTFKNPGIVTIGCNIHDGMISHIFISDAPFAAQTDADGHVQLEGVPSGDGELVVWHPLLRQRGNRILQTLSVDADLAPVVLSGKFRKGATRSSDY